MKIIENFVLDNRAGALIKEAGHDHLIIKNGTIDLYETDPTTTIGLVGIDIRRCQLVEIINVKIRAHDLKRKFAYGIRSGYSGDPLAANLKVQISNCEIGGFGPIYAGYDLNRDCIAAEIGVDLWIKDTIFDGATDGCVDCKTTYLKMARCRLSNSYRLNRGWGGIDRIFSECTFDTPNDHLWNYDATVKTTLFNSVFKQPMKTSYDQAPSVITYATTNPLTDPWFSKGSDFSKLITAQQHKIAAEQEFLEALKSL